jgi:hypothetical protein
MTLYPIIGKPIQTQPLYSTLQHAHLNVFLGDNPQYVYLPILANMMRTVYSLKNETTRQAPQTDGDVEGEGEGGIKRSYQSLS